MLSPAESLLGKVLDGGWTVVEKFEPKTYSTGGNFSVGYTVVRKSDGSKAFLKALDFLRAASGDNFAKDVEDFFHDYNFEAAINDRCKGLDRVVACLAYGIIEGEPGNPLGRIPYLIFEIAEGNIRRQLRHVPGSLAWKFRALHHIATGMDQLHGRKIVHQDLKPSNVMVFTQVSKVGDLGRANCTDQPSRFDSRAFAGDRDYAPPEILYRDPMQDFVAQRKATDLFMLGSMIVFTLGGVTLQAALLEGLPLELHPYNRACTFEQARPLIQANFAKCLTSVRAQAGELGTRAASLVERLGEPEPRRRGNVTGAPFHQDQYSLHPFVSELDLLARQAQEAGI